MSKDLPTEKYMQISDYTIICYVIPSYCMFSLYSNKKSRQLLRSCTVCVLKVFLYCSRAVKLQPLLPPTGQRRYCRSESCTMALGSLVLLLPQGLSILFLLQVYDKAYYFTVVNVECYHPYIFMVFSYNVFCFISNQGWDSSNWKAT